MEDRKVGKGSISLILRTLATGGFVPTSEPTDADLVLANAFPSRNLLSKFSPGCMINHFPGEHELCSKDRMAKLLRHMPFCPQTFVLPEEETDSSRRIGQTRKMCFWNANCEDCEDCFFWEGEFPSLVKS